MTKRSDKARKASDKAREKAQKECPHPPKKQKFVGYGTVCDPRNDGCGKLLR